MQKHSPITSKFGMSNMADENQDRLGSIISGKTSPSNFRSSLRKETSPGRTMIPLRSKFAASVALNPFSKGGKPTNDPIDNAKLKSTYF